MTLRRSTEWLVSEENLYRIRSRQLHLFRQSSLAGVHWIKAAYSRARAGLLCLLLTLVLEGCDAFGTPYNITVANHGINGVILLDFPVTKTGPGFAPKPPRPGGMRDRWRIYPGLASIDNYWFRTFAGHVHSLPDEVEIKWQIAELSNCDKVYTSPYFPGYILKRGCTWTPIQGKIFTKDLDIQEIRQSEAYKKAGDSSGVPFHPYYMRLRFIFLEDQLHVVPVKVHGSGMHFTDDPNTW